MSAGSVTVIITAHITKNIKSAIERISVAINRNAGKRIGNGSLSIYLTKVA
jgi:hypothetical protein